ncbi:pyrophosphatase PpaX [Listeria grayi]|uniref:Pyrophosphatase PpaX n=1 Tax=Listeria grayi TaxID=1641 RepID=A0A378MCN7_LISGR|nr:pyrophosphatase PpaX [Listeria grayi]
MAKAKKPLAGNFKKAMEALDATPEETIMIGDQIMTDIWGGNRQQLYTIFVKPVKETDGFITKFNRMMERMILKSLRKKQI